MLKGDGANLRSPRPLMMQEFYLLMPLSVTRAM